MARQRISCEECPVFQPFRQLLQEGDAEIAYDEFQLFVPNLGEAGIRAAIEEDIDLALTAQEGTKRCPGWPKMSKASRLGAIIFDGRAWLEYIEKTRCENPVFRDSEFQARCRESLKRVQDAMSARTVKKPQGNID